MRLTVFRLMLLGVTLFALTSCEGRSQLTGPTVSVTCHAAAQGGDVKVDTHCDKDHDNPVSNPVAPAVQ